MGVTEEPCMRAWRVDRSIHPAQMGTIEHPSENHWIAYEARTRHGDPTGDKGPRWDQELRDEARSRALRQEESHLSTVGGFHPRGLTLVTLRAVARGKSKSAHEASRPWYSSRDMTPITLTAATFATLTARPHRDRNANTAARLAIEHNLDSNFNRLVE